MEENDRTHQGENVATKRRKNFPFWGVILILVGIFALLESLGVIPGSSWDFFWPLLLIILGVALIYDHYRK